MQDDKMNRQNILSEIESPIFSAAWRDLTDGATVEYDGNTYTIGTDAFGSFEAAKEAGHADAISLDIYVNTEWAASGTASAQGYEITLGVDGFNNLADAYRAQDRLNILAIADVKRHEYIHNVKTFIEQGIKGVDDTSVNFRGYAFPKGVDPSIVAKAAKIVIKNALSVLGVSASHNQFSAQK